MILIPAAITVVWLSTYDWQNNSPPGAGISYARDYGYPTVHDHAGGTGTWADPITFASQPGQLRPGQRIYVPRFGKYFVKEDDCSTCYTRAWQFDLWVPGVTAAQNASQDPASIVNLWGRYRVILDPPRGLPVTRTPFRRQHP